MHAHTFTVHYHCSNCSTNLKKLFCQGEIRNISLGKNKEIKVDKNKAYGLRNGIRMQRNQVYGVGANQEQEDDYVNGMDGPASDTAYDYDYVDV